MIELRCAVVAAANEGENLSGVWVQCDERDLRVSDGRGALAVLLADDFVDVLDTGLDGSGSDGLQVGIERRVDAEVLVGEVLVADALDELVVYQVDEVGGFAGVDVGRREMERLSFSAVCLGLGDGSGFDHGVEDDVAALNGTLRMPVGIETAWTLDHSGEQSVLRGIQLLEVFAEEGLRSLTKAVDVVAAAMAEVDLVGVHLEDLLFRESCFELKGDEQLDHLPLEAFFWRQEEVFGKLLRKSRSTATAFAGEDIGDSALDKAAVVEPAMFEEVAIFYGCDGLNKFRRNVRVAEHAALSAVLVLGERGDELGF